MTADELEAEITRDLQEIRRLTTTVVTNTLRWVAALARTHEPSVVKIAAQIADGNGCLEVIGFLGDDGAVLPASESLDELHDALINGQLYVLDDSNRDVWMPYATATPRSTPTLDLAKIRADLG